MRVAKALDPRSRELYAKVGERIREARLDRQLSQGQLGRRVSLTRASISNLELGRQKLLLHTLYDIAVALGVQPSALLPPLSLGPVEEGTLEQEMPRGLRIDEQAWIVAVATTPAVGQ
jgi:transcriptional regulator with XRE-family HTH domain